MAWAILVESIHAVSGSSRQEVESLIDDVEASLARTRNNIRQKIGAALSSARNDAEGADAIAQISADRSFNRDAVRLVTSFAATIWGAGIVSAGLNATGAVVAVGLGVELAPIIAILLGLLIMFYCGSYAFGVIRELLGRLSTASSALEQ